ncbi:glucose-6-phosphate isomerase [Phreatobacter cathodiphilus]|uniref:Glucose-6-phosphate isomerase n=1 Tax=Phreatobacter cathodiphilus TaxID=1868589 RepID=A0A2S0NGW5_9HYPH|nr:glucose-6-phosphate isomerase [Phreatobacter cathodiphilus]AVO47420.1 glucose-6-phosphate isomerase [Phreatobacter cathodiphilus]
MTDAVTRAFEALEANRRAMMVMSLPELFGEDPRRFERFSLKLGPLLMDFSKTRVATSTMRLLVDLAKAAGVEEKRDAMFAGERINVTENRAVLHVALRNLSGAPMMCDGRDVMPEVAAERERCFAFAEAVRTGALRGATGKRFTTIVNIGIGGSDLGPAMAAEALSPYIRRGLSVRFVSNVDGAHIADTLRGLDPARTLFVVVSKTFTTVETMTNAQTARNWVAQALGEDAVGAHFAAVSTNLAAVNAFGIAEAAMFRFWDWVGGRYSVWSAVGLSLMIAVGPRHFTAFLAGAERVDQHFRTAPLKRNMPVIMGLLGLWHRNVWSYASHAVLPYDQRLARLPAHLQQLDMESLGKGVTMEGKAVTRPTGPIIWGEPGTNGQHAFFQLLHQGTEIVPCDFLVAASPHERGRRHHDLLIANCLAQSKAMMKGRSFEEARDQLIARGMSRAEAERLAPHRVFPGDRPSTTFLYRKLDPATLGMIVALYEHKVFVMAAVLGINAFDQWGVELGKELATVLEPLVAGPGGAEEGLDSSTAGLLAQLRKLRV